jgi:beta-glucosidase
MLQARLLCVVCVVCFSLAAKQLWWDWDSIDTSKVNFPPGFLFGCADSALQTEGLVTTDGRMVENSWTAFEQLNNLPVRVGVACQRWVYYKQDIQLLKNVGMNAYRFSVDWSKIEPQEGVFDHQAMQHYCDMVDELLAQNIVPMITLLHHVCPSWFMKKKGFEKENNIADFVRFSVYVFKHLHQKINFWLIFNEPVAYAFEGYFLGKYPPGKKSLTLAGKVILNQLNAHVAVAQEFRKIDNRAKIGIAHMSHPIDAYSWWNPLENVVTKLFSHLMNDTTIKFFKNGQFKWAPTLVRGYNKDAPRSLDFIGVNYYTHTTLKQINPFKMEATVRPEEKIVDNCRDPKRAKVMYPEGLYRSIKRAAKLNLPIYITENGAATSDPVLKDEYLKKHLYVVSKAIKEGYPIKGYFFWTLMDCFSWNKGYDNKHGIYAVDFVTQERTLRSGNDYLLNIVKRFAS